MSEEQAGLRRRQPKCTACGSGRRAISSDGKDQVTLVDRNRKNLRAVQPVRYWQRKVSAIRGQSASQSQQEE